MYSGPAATVYLTQLYTLTVQTGSNPQGVSVWVDWNHDGDYLDTGELVFSGYLGSPSALYTATISIPGGIPTGNTKMRVRSRAGSAPTNPCTHYAEGETEDYCIDVQGPICIWTGTVPSGAVWGHWTNPNNWDCGYVPTINNQVIIPNTPIQPAIVLADGNALSVNMHNGTKLNIVHNRRLNVATNWTAGTGTGAEVTFNPGPVRMLSQGGPSSISGNTRFQNLEIHAGANTVSIPSGAVSIRQGLDLMSGTLNTLGNLTLLASLPHTAAFIDNFSTGYTGTLVGNVTAQRRIPRSGGIFMSSPVNAGTISDITTDIGGTGHNGIGGDGSYFIADPTCTYQAPTSPWARVMQYDESAVTTCHFNGWQIRLSGSTTNGRGYLVNQPAAQLLYDFTGAANTGSISATVTRTATNTTATVGTNLLGNPYPSGINLDAFYAANSGVIGTAAYLYNGSTFNTVVMNDAVPSHISSFQGFQVVRTSVGSDPVTVTFNQGMRVRGNTISFTDEPNLSHKLVVEVRGRDAEHRDVTYVYFGEELSDGFDLKEDGYKFYSVEGYPTLYTLAPGMSWPVSLNGLSIGTTLKELPLGLHPGSSGQFVFTLKGGDRLPSGMRCTLVDKKEGKEVEVGEESSYVFEASGVELRDRFVLRFRREVGVAQNEGVQTPEKESRVEEEMGVEADRAWSVGNRVYLSLGQEVPGRLMLRLMDMSGKIVWTDAIENAVRGVYDLGELEVSGGLYILNWGDGRWSRSARLPLGLTK